MKMLKSWISAAVVCSALASQANADVFMLASGNDARDAISVTNLKSFVGIGNVPVKNQRQTNRESSVFVPGSLINKSSQGAWLMSQSVQPNDVARPQKVALNAIATPDQRITPILPTGTETRPVSTFAQFVQIFKPSQNSQNDSDPVHAMVSSEITPMTSSMALIGVLASGLAGITGLISASRHGLFRRTAR